MAALATTSDVAALFQQALTDVQTLAAVNLLERASAMIRLAAPGIDARIVLSTDLATVVRGVAVDSVLRVLRNPQGFITENVDIYAYRRSDAVADGRLYLTPGELAVLRPTAGSARVGSQQLTTYGYGP